GGGGGGRGGGAGGKGGALVDPGGGAGLVVPDVEVAVACLVDAIDRPAEADALSAAERDLHGFRAADAALGGLPQPEADLEPAGRDVAAVLGLRGEERPARVEDRFALRLERDLARRWHALAPGVDPLCGEREERLGV